jgi:hypothetical protein
MANQEERINIGPGRAVYPRLDRPDTKYDELGAYKADLAVPQEEAADNMKRLAAIFKEHTGKAPNKLDNTMWLMETDDEGEPTGNVMFKIRVKNKMTKKGELWDRKPKQFDASLRPCSVNPWGGSVLAVSANIYCWKNKDKAGVSLQPVAVQIIELVSGEGGGGAGPTDLGFEKKDGFVTEDDGFEEATVITAATNDDDYDADY